MPECCDGVSKASGMCVVTIRGKQAKDVGGEGKMREILGRSRWVEFGGLVWCREGTETKVDAGQGKVGLEIEGGSRDP